MSTAISTDVKPVDYPALAVGSRQAAIIQANLDGEPMREQDLVRVPTPAGGATKWNVDTNGNVESTDELVGVLVAIGKRGVLWPKADPSDMRPVIVTHDLIIGYRVSDELGEIDPKSLEKYRLGDRKYDWTAISTSPEFGWGAGKGSGAGKKVKESRVLALLRQGETWPILVTIGPGSLAVFEPFRKRLPNFHYGCVVGLRLQKVKSSGGQPYSQIVPRLVGTISDEQAEVARATYTVPLKAMFNAPPAGSPVVSHEDE
jgi:hypothetical protein